MIRAVFFDIDGTLLSFKTHQVSKGTIAAFDRLHRLGIKTFISSGRPAAIIPPMPVSFDGHITMNGGYVFVGDKVIHKCPIPQEETDRWFALAKERQICTMCFTANETYLSQPNEIGIAIRNQLEFTMPPTTDIDNLIGKETFQLIGVIPAEMDAEVTALLPHVKLPRWHPKFTDIINKESSKAVGIAKICSYFGIPKEETLALGDGENDIEMLKYCGIGVAMGNANDYVKSQADYVTSSVDDEGILHAIEHFIKEG